MLIEVMFYHICWVAALYTALTVLRAPNAWGFDTKTGTINSLKEYEPKVGANLSNQFEWPLFFYVCALLSIVLNINDTVFNVLAWCFIVGRLIHSGVHILTNNIRFRGAVFTINFVAVLLMWVRLYWLVQSNA